MNGVLMLNINCLKVEESVELQTAFVVIKGKGGIIPRVDGAP